MKFAEAAFEYARAKGRFETALVELDSPASPLDWDDISVDEYDHSIELYRVPNDCRLSDTQQRFLFEAGFCSCWLNHQDGWESYYRFRENDQFRPSEGWRKERAGIVKSVLTAE